MLLHKYINIYTVTLLSAPPSGDVQLLGERSSAGTVLFNTDSVFMCPRRNDVTDGGTFAKNCFVFGFINARKDNIEVISGHIKGISWRAERSNNVTISNY